MGLISVIILQCSSSNEAIQQTMCSLSAHTAQIQNVYLISAAIRHRDMYKEKHHSGFEFSYVPARNQDIGEAINQLIPSISTEYVMFLYANDILTNSIWDFTSFLNEHQSVLSLPPDRQGISCYRPFLVKTSRLREGPLFYRADQVPFSEAVLPAWLAHINRSEVVDLPEKVIRPARQRLRTNDRYIYEALASFQPKELVSAELLSPSVTVIIATYNMGHFLDTALASLATQTEQPSQILLIDDGSSDHTQEKIKKWLNLYNITVLQIENVGKAKALNQLLPLVKSDFILEMDADDWLDPNALSVIRKHLLDFPPESSLLYGNLRMWKQHTSGVLWCRGIKYGELISNTDDLLRIHLPLGPRIYRTSTLVQVGGYPIVKFAEGRLYEDVLLIRLLMERDTILYRDFTVYNVREHPTSITKRNLSKWREFQNNWNEHLADVTEDE